MNDVLLMGGIVVALAALVALIVWLRRRPRRLKTKYFQAKWRELQKLCASKESWSQAIFEADKLLDEALKKKRFAGKTVGERLTKAQRMITDNEAVWFGHKLRNRLLDDPATKLKEKDVKDALIGIRQALKDLGALPGNKIEQAAPVPEIKAAATPKAQSTEKAKQSPKPRPATRKPLPDPKPRRKVVQ
jgi:hypothetical protein